MITIYKSHSMKDAAAYVMGVLDNVDKSNLDVTHTVIVPDRASMEAERALLQKLGGSFNVRVRTFRRLANEVLPKLAYLSKQAGIMALTGIIQDNKDKLSCFVRGAETPGFVSDMYDVISMMKYCRIPPQALLEGELPEGVKGKAHDVGVLYKAYCDFSQCRYVDSADKLELFCEAVKTSEQIKNGYFYLYDFDNFSAQELGIVEQLALHSKGVTVACCAGEGERNAHLYLNDIYEGVLDVCRKNGITPQINASDGGYDNALVRQIGENLFRYGKAAPVECGDAVETYRGSTRVQEVYSLACRIQDYVRQGGRFRDVYVVTSDVDKYYNAVSTVFGQFDIPYFCDRQYVLAAHPYARFITDYFTLCKNNGRQREVLRFVKNPLFCGNFSSETPSVDEDVYYFENFCLKYNVSFNYDSFQGFEGDAYCARAESFRKKFHSLYEDFKPPKKGTVGGFADCVRRLAELTSLREKAEQLARQQQALGLLYESKVTSQAAEKLDGVLAQTEVLADREVTLEEFLRIFSAALSSVKISVLPVTNDSVVFANMAKARKHDIKFLALLGANNGAMPIVKSDCKLLSDRNIQQLCDAGIRVEPKIFVENKRERFSLFQLLLEPQKLYVSYAESDGASSLLPSQFVKELQKLFVKNGEQLRDSDSTCEKVYTPQQALSKLITGRRRLADNQPVNTPCLDVLQKHFGKEAEKYAYRGDVTVRIKRGREFYLYDSRLSVSRITEFYKCPYEYFWKYGLHVKPREVAEINAADAGNILHDVLDKFVKKTSASLSDSQARQIAEQCFEETMSDKRYRGAFADVRMQGLRRQLHSESVRMCSVVRKQMASSLFVNKETEMSFGGEGAYPAVEVDYGDGKIYLNGKVDRLDEWQGRFVVIDYKSGKEASQYNEQQLYQGWQLQLPVYVKAVEQAFPGTEPVGFYYFHMHDTFAEKEASYCYNGRTLDDLTVINALDTDLSRQPNLLGLSFTKGGEINKNQKRKLLSAEQLQNQKQYALLMVKQAGRLMAEGFSDVTPCTRKCDVCDYADVCDAKDVLNVTPREDVSSVTAETIDEAVSNE